MAKRGGTSHWVGQTKTPQTVKASSKKGGKAGNRRGGGKGGTVCDKVGRGGRTTCPCNKGSGVGRGKMKCRYWARRADA